MTSCLPFEQIGCIVCMLMNIANPFAGGCTEYRGRQHSYAQICQQSGCILCCAASTSSHAHASPYPHRNQRHGRALLVERQAVITVFV